jgi:hypothetical protein
MTGGFVEHVYPTQAAQQCDQNHISDSYELENTQTGAKHKLYSTNQSLRWVCNFVEHISVT